MSPSPSSSIADQWHDFRLYQVTSDNLVAGNILLIAPWNGISILALRRQPGITCHAAWRMKHNLMMQMMKERDESRPLSACIQVDDAYWGDEFYGGKRGYGAEYKTPFQAALQANEEGHPIRMRFTTLKGLRKTEIIECRKR